MPRSARSGSAAGRSFEVGGVRWWPAAGADPDAVRAAVGRALEAVAGGRVANRKSGRRKELYAVALAGPDEPDHLLKVSHYPPLVGVRRRLLASKARRELALAEDLAARGIATPVPLAAGERRALGRVATCYLLVPLVRGARDLRQVGADPALPCAERRALAAAFGALARRLHDAGVWQDDFQPNNFLRGPGGPSDLRVIDFERVRLRRALPPPARAAMLAKLERELPQASLAERARFLRAYAGGERAQARALWGAVARAVRALAVRDAARLARMLRSGGRRFERVEAAGWRGLRDAALDDSLGALAELAAGVDAGARRDAATERGAGGAAGFELHASGPSLFALSLPAAGNPARRAYARAHVLARRGGLAPRPLALLERSGRALLVFAGPLPERLDALDPAARRSRLPALARLLLRLAALGELPERPPARLFGAASPGAAVRVALLAPPLLALGGRGALPRRSEARALAARILEPPAG